MINLRIIKFKLFTLYLYQNTVIRKVRKIIATKINTPCTQVILLSSIASLISPTMVHGALFPHHIG